MEPQCKSYSQPLNNRAVYFVKVGDADTALRVMNGREIEGSNISMTKLIPNVDDYSMHKVQGGDNDEMDAMTQTQL